MAGAALSLLALAAVIYFGLYPRPPIEPVLDPNTLYRDGVAVGHVSGFTMMPAYSSEQYKLQVEASKPIEDGDVLRFRHTVCIVLELGQQRKLPNNIVQFDDMICRVVSG